MSVSKSGCYRWRERQGKLNRYEQDRQLLTKLLAEQHKKHPSHGYPMSKGGTPADNAIIEAMNGWIKEELFLDFSLATAKDVPNLLDEYVHYYNHERPAAALGYKSPVQYKTELGF